MGRPGRVGWGVEAAGRRRKRLRWILRYLPVGRRRNAQQHLLRERCRRAVSESNAAAEDLSANRMQETRSAGRGGVRARGDGEMRMWNRPARSGPKQCARDVRDTPAAADSSGALPPISQEAAHLSGAAAVPTTVPRMPICSLASGVDLPYGFARCREPGVRRVAPEGIGFWTGAPGFRRGQGWGGQANC